MAKGKPTVAQAQLQLQLYDLRREARIRQAREWYLENFFPETMEDLQRLAPPGSQENVSMRMVVSYWDQACLLANYGLLHEDLFFLTGGEFFRVWERIEPVVGAMRQGFRNPHMFSNLEKAAQRYKKWSERRAPGSLDAMRQYMQQSRKAAAAV